MKAIVIGCGNIGALYDLNSREVKTHCKALYNLQTVEVSVFDENKVLARTVSDKYNFTFIKNKEEIELDKFHWVIIASSTSSHFSLLKACFSSGVPFVICEKPISKNAQELAELENLYKQGDTTVLVNFIRRFQPEYHRLKDYIGEYRNEISHIAIKYQRGIINNFSHAADLLSLCLGDHSFDKLNITEAVFDEFDDDPTVSFTSTYSGIPLSVIGLANVKYSFFEIDFYFIDKKISLKENGNKIVYCSSLMQENFYQPLVKDNAQSKDDLLINYMTNVYEYALNVYQKKGPDNFLSALQMNQHILEIIKK